MRILIGVGVVVVDHMVKSIILWAQTKNAKYQTVVDKHTLDAMHKQHDLQFAAVDANQHGKDAANFCVSNISNTYIHKMELF